jgi:hypothetical protein
MAGLMQRAITAEFDRLPIATREDRAWFDAWRGRGPQGPGEVSAMAACYALLFAIFALGGGAWWPAVGAGAALVIWLSWLDARMAQRSRMELLTRVEEDRTRSDARDYRPRPCYVIDSSGRLIGRIYPSDAAAASISL